MSRHGGCRFAPPARYPSSLFLILIPIPGNTLVDSVRDRCVCYHWVHLARAREHAGVRYVQAVHAPHFSAHMKWAVVPLRHSVGVDDSQLTANVVRRTGMWIALLGGLLENTEVVEESSKPLDR